MSPLLIIGLVVLAVILFLISVYNQFQTLKTRIAASIQEIGNQLKRQVDLIPNLENSVKGYLTHEQTIFTKLTEARTAVSSALKHQTAASMDKATDTVQNLLGSLRVVVESTPELKAEATVSQLMDELRDTADKVMYARRTLIDLTADYNRLVVTIPSNIVASLFGFQPQPGLSTPETGQHVSVKPTDLETPKVSL